MLPSGVPSPASGGFVLVDVSNAPASEETRSLTRGGVDPTGLRMVGCVGFGVVVAVENADRISVGLVIDGRVPGVGLCGSTPSVLLGDMSIIVGMSTVVSTSWFGLGSGAPKVAASNCDGAFTSAYGVGPAPQFGPTHPASTGGPPTPYGPGIAVPNGRFPVK